MLVQKQYCDLIPWVINLELTNACNLSCVFCDHPVLKKNMKIKEMDDQIIIKVFSDVNEIIKKNNNEKIHELGLVGLGEPLLNPSLERHLEIINHNINMFERVSINSNLVFLKEKIVKILISSGINVYTFSINASNKDIYKKLMGRNSFDPVIKNINKFLELLKRENKKVKVEVQLVESEKNEIEELKALIPLSDELDVRFFFRKMYSKPVIKESTEDVIVYMGNDNKRYPCWDMFSKMYIDVEGNFYPCTIGNDSYREKSEFCLGSVQKASIFSLFNCEEIKNKRYQSEKGKLPFIGCKICNIWATIPNNFYWDKKNQSWHKKRKQVRAFGLKG